MTEYSFSRKESTPAQMLLLITRSWFTSPPLSLGCLFILLFMPFYFLVLCLQIALFLPVLPIITLVYLPVSIFLYKRQEKSWLFWAAIYAGCATLLSALPIMLFLENSETPFIIGAFIILSALCGMYVYFNLYNANNTEIEIEDKND